MTKQNRLIVGCGYLGRRVAEAWIAAGHDVSAITRCSKKAERLAAASIIPIVSDITQPGALGEFCRFDAVLFAVGFDRTADRTIHEVYVGGLVNVLRALSANPPHRFVYISSTGVYGNAGGQWINEESPCEPIREGGKACLAAETLLAASPLKDRSLILRLAGLYGPGRLPRKEELLSGVSISASETGYLNLIHVEDAAAAVNVALSQAKPPRTYLVTDGSPVVRGEYYREVARQLGAPPPQFDTSGDSSRIARAAGDKRVCCGRIVRELGFTPRYKNFCQGIAASLLADQ
jgi:nucleoside-diphosphate-sugar epimerase